MSLRILVIGTSAILFVTTTHPSDLAAALVKWKVPNSIAFMLLATFQIIPIIAREAKIIMEAQQARCLDIKASVIQRVKNLIPLFAPLFITTFMKIHQLAKVLECRAFSSNCKKTSLRVTKMTMMDHSFILLMGVLIGTEVYLKFSTIDTLTNGTLLISFLVTIWVVCGLLIIKFAAKKLMVAVAGGGR
jgi:energy-coupling factor transport system permease protein